ncbi:MAG: metalloregulator ArsR/SmtB family transcription factor [Bacillota bacterium]|nr:metalloregulator ArsR/SmtB family transcription factor [Bacillota bacterium]
MIDFTIMLKALADKTRFQIVNLLLTHDFCVGALAHRLGVSKAAVSQHLKVLREAGLVNGEKRGYWTHYSVDKNVLMQMADEMRNMANKPVDTKSVCRKDTNNKDECCVKKEG